VHSRSPIRPHLVEDDAGEGLHPGEHDRVVTDGVAPIKAVPI
jgi:hypothetical protein